MIEILRERLQIHVCRVHGPVKLGPRLVGNVAGRHGHGLDALCAAGFGDIDGIFRENDGIVVGECDRMAAETLRGGGDGVRRRGVAQPVRLPRLADVPVLAEPAAEIASRRAKRQHTRARQKMVERLFFNRIDAEPAAPTVGREHHLVAGPLPDKAEAALVLLQLAETRTQPAFHPAVRQQGPPPGRIVGCGWLHGHGSNLPPPRSAVP